MNKILIHIIGATIILGVGASLFVFALNSDGIAHKILDVFFGNRLTMYIHALACFVVCIDAVRRKVPYVFLWSLVMFIFPIIGILLYLGLAERPPVPESTGNERTSRLCPHCASITSRLLRSVHTAALELITVEN